MQILSSLLILAENIHQKICQHIVIACHGIGYVKKLRKHHKIDCNIILTRFQDLMLRKLIEKKQLTFIHYDPFSIDDISEGALAHIQHLHKIMPVRRKIYEPGVSTHCNQSAFLEHLATVHSKIPAGCIEIFVHLCLSVQDSPLFICNFSQLIQ